MFIIQFFITYLKPLLFTVGGFFTFYLLRKNKDLETKNIINDKNLVETKKVVDVQNKIIDVTKNTKRTNIAGNVERMRKKKL